MAETLVANLATERQAHTQQPCPLCHTWYASAIMPAALLFRCAGARRGASMLLRSKEVHWQAVCGEGSWGVAAARQGSRKSRRPPGLACGGGNKPHRPAVKCFANHRAPHGIDVAAHEPQHADEYHCKGGGPGFGDMPWKRQATLAGQAAECMRLCVAHDPMLQRHPCMATHKYMTGT